MDIQTFQKKIIDICQLAKKNGQMLTMEQIQNEFRDMQLESQQLNEICKYLKTTGIRVLSEDSMEAGDMVDASNQPDKKNMDGHLDMPDMAEKRRLYETENPCLTNEDKDYLRKYEEELEETLKTSDEKLFFYMIEGARMAAEMYRDKMLLPDLIQDANICLITLLEEEKSKEVSQMDILSRLRAGIKEAVNMQDEQNFGDEYLVSKVNKLDSVMKELTEEDEGDPKFSVEELAIMLDMDIDEMNDVIRLTGGM